MSIAWDENQLPALTGWVEEKLPLSSGGVIVESAEIPDNCFAGTVDIKLKEFTVFTSIESSMSDTTMNIFLGYIVAMAYAETGWGDLPDQATLFECHRKVCASVLELNEEFSAALEDHIDILLKWHETQVEAQDNDSPESLVEEMGSSLFSTQNPTNNKNYGSN